MKKLFSLMVIAAMSITMVGCKKEEPKPATPAPATPAPGTPEPAKTP
jgi:uncharacterized lipoprotein YbaY